MVSESLVSESFQNQCEEDEIPDDDFPAKELWIELRSKEALKNAFKENALDEFWTERL